MPTWVRLRVSADQTRQLAEPAVRTSQPAFHTIGGLHAGFVRFLRCETSRRAACCRRACERATMTTAHPEKTLAAVLFLMAVYRRTQCPVVARAIAAHLTCLARHGEVSDSVRRVCAGLKDEWECVAAAFNVSPLVH